MAMTQFYADVAAKAKNWHSQAPVSAVCEGRGETTSSPRRPIPYFGTGLCLFRDIDVARANATTQEETGRGEEQGSRWNEG
jgi:hypothetical protein